MKSDSHPMARCSLLLFFAAASLVETAQAAASVTLNGQTYQLKDHPRVWLDGPSGPLTLSLSDTSPSGRANLNNPSYAAITTSVNNFIAAGYQFPNSDFAHNAFDPFSHTVNAALRWQADGDPNSLALVKYELNHVEDIVGGNMG